MLAPTHSVFGIFLTLIILALFGIQLSLHWTIILFAIIGSIIPDIDHPRSTVGRMFSFISIPLERRYGHRTITHSFLGWLISTIIFAVLIFFLFCILKFVCNLYLVSWDLLPRWIAAFSISYFSHLFLDMFNPRGSQMFWPEKGRDVIPKNPKFRPESGSRIEVAIFFIFLIFMLLALPISKYGIASSLRWLLATPGSAIEEYKSLKTHAYLDFKGMVNETKETVSGKGEILGVENKRLIILYKGSVYTLSDELAADIIATHVRVKSTKIPISIEHKEFSDKTRDYLLSQTPKDALISGIIHLPEGVTLKLPDYQGAYKPIEQKSNDLVLSFASKEEIRRLKLDSKYDLENKKNIVELSKLRVDLSKTRYQINEINGGDGLTELGKKILLGNKSEKQNIQLAELESQSKEISVRIDELQSKIDSRKLVFSGEVYIRQ